VPIEVAIQKLRGFIADQEAKIVKTNENELQLAITDTQAAPKVFNVAGNHTLELFFADVQTIQSALTFSCAGCEDPTSTVPEPATLALFGTTLVGLGVVIRRHLKDGNKGA